MSWFFLLSHMMVFWSKLDKFWKLINDRCLFELSFVHSTKLFSFSFFFIFLANVCSFTSFGMSYFRFPHLKFPIKIWASIEPHHNKRKITKKSLIFIDIRWEIFINDFTPDPEPFPFNSFFLQLKYEHLLTLVCFSKVGFLHHAIRLKIHKSEILFGRKTILRLLSKIQGMSSVSKHVLD